MELFQNEPVVQKITVALFVPAGSGAPVHNNRPSHGLAYNANHSTTYRFSDGQILTCNLQITAPRIGFQMGRF